MRAFGQILGAILIFTVSISAVHGASNTTVPEPKKQPSEISPTVPSQSHVPLVNGKPLQQILNSKEYVESLVRYLVGYETWIYICTDAQPEERIRTLMVTEPVDLPEIDRVDAPQWLEVVKIRGCNKTYERMVFATYHQGKPVFHAQIAGNSKTSPRLQHQAVTALRAAASTAAQAEGCDRADRARVLSAELDEAWPKASKSQWREVWVVHACKGTKDVPVVFTSDDSGKITFRFELP